MHTALATLLLTAALAPGVPAAPGGCEAEQYGTGLGGANTGNLFTFSTPQLGATMVLSMNEFTPDPSFGPGIGAVVFSVDEDFLPFLGGVLLVDVGGLFASNVVLYDIYAETVVGVPDNPALVGFSVYAQTALNFESSIGWAFSNGLRLTFCS